MSLSKDDLPGNFYTNEIPTYDVSGLKLSSGYVDINKLLRFQRVDFNNNRTVPTSGTAVYLDINPSNLSIAMSKAINPSNYTRAGFVPQYWGEELDIVSAQGTSAAFIHDKDGITRQKASETVAYKNFMNLLLLYKNNGANYTKKDLSDTISPSRSGGYNSISQIKSAYKKSLVDNNNNNLVFSSTRKTIDTRSLIELKYFDLLCYGNFESFNYVESAEKPFNFDYSFEFVVLFYNTPNQVDGHIKK